VGIHVLGPVEVDGGESLRPRDRQVLAALAVRSRRSVTPEEIADAVWGDEPPASWSKQVQICVAHLRKVLEPGAIETSPEGGYRLTSRTEVNSERFEELVARGRQLAATGEPDRAASVLAGALALVRGNPYRSLDHWAPATGEIARLTDLIRTAEEDLLEARLAVGEHREVASRAPAQVAEEPLRERRWAALALAQYRCGRQADALRSIRQARAVLREQLGVDPGPDLVALEARILRQDESLRAIAEPRPMSDQCPYKGLAPLDAGDPLFGRDAELATCLARSGDTGLLVVTGPSGSGKSSLVRAGLVPALEGRGRRCHVVVPDATGTVDLPDGSAPAPVLVVDQFEQVLVADMPLSAVRETCAVLAGYAASRALVIITVRADHLAGLAIDPTLGRLAENNMLLLGPLTGDALLEAIQRPAGDAGLRVEPGLIELVVRDVEGEAGALPLMSHALAETWRRREGNVLTVAAYRNSGGIRGAVARSADRLYESLPPEQRAVLRSVLLRLVMPSLEGEPLRRRIPSRALGADPARDQILVRLISARLVTAEDGVLEISHEALVRAWPRLQAWLDEDAAGLRVLRHLAVAADGWDSLGRPDAELYRGARLEAAQEYRESGSGDLTPGERDFLDASLRQSASDTAALRAQALTDSRRNRRLRVLLAAAVSFLLVAVATGVVADRRGDDARRAAEQATIEAVVNQSLVLRGTDRDAAALLAVEAHRRWPDDPRALSALVGTFTGSPGFVSNQNVDDAVSLTGALIPGTAEVIVARDWTRPFVMNMVTGETIRAMGTVPGDEPVFGRGVAVNAEGRRAAMLIALPKASCGDQAAVTADGTCGAFVVYDIDSGQPVTDAVVTPDGPGAIALAADGTLVAVVGSGSGVVTVHDASNGRVLSRLPGLAGPSVGSSQRDAGAVVFGPDDTLYATSLAGAVRAIDPRSGAVLRTLPAPAGHSEQHATLSTDGLLVVGGRLGLAAFNTRSAEPLWTADLSGSSPDPCPWFAAAEATERLYCGTHYGEVEERDRATGQRTGRTLDTQLGSVGELAVTADGSELVAFGAETPAITRWRLDGSGPASMRIADGYVAFDRFGYDDNSLVVARRPQDATTDADLTDYALWDTDQNRMIDDISPDLRDGIEGIGWAGRGLLIGMDASASQMRWYDVATRALIDGPRIGVECAHLWASADGQRAYCGGTDGQVWTIDIAARRLVEPTIRVDGWVRSVSETQGGKTLVVTSATDRGPQTVVLDAASDEVLAGPIVGPAITSVSPDGTLFGTTAGAITRYDLETLQPLTQLPGARGEVNTLQFSADGRLLLATSNDQTAALYDVATGTRLGDPIETSAPLIYPAFLRPDGAALAVTDAKGVVVWDLDPAHLADAACAMAGRNLTPSEWTSYLPDLGSYRQTCREVEIRDATS
jgi:DNA-binding SARP family transcriptional activator/WD40 repeat protein/energy-coupling factor transporter ATP-binding protein EcfA2